MSVRLKKGDYQFKIIIFGFDVGSLDETAIMFTEKLSQLKAKFSLIYPKTWKERYTVLTSPHKHKSAQKHYKKKTHFRTLCVADLENLEKLKTLKVSERIGIRIKINKKS